MRWTHWGWLGSLTVAFVIGRKTVPVPTREIVEPEAPSCSIPPPAHAHTSLVARWRPREPSPTAAPAGKAQTFHLGEPKNLDEVTRRMMAYAEQKLREGPDGYLELLDTFDREIMKKQALLHQIGNGANATRQLYPWLRFFIEHESEMLEVTDTAYATMAADPNRFADFDPATLELLTQGIATLLPGASSDDQLEVLRGHAQAILELPADQLPESVSRQLGNLERDLDMWAPELTADEAVDRVSLGVTDGREARRLLSQIDSETLSTLDPVAVFGTQLERGDLGAIGYLGMFPLDPGAIATLDERLLTGSGGTLDPYAIASYLGTTGRANPDAFNAFFARAADSPRAEAFQEARRVMFENVLY